MSEGSSKEIVIMLKSMFDNKAGRKMDRYMLSPALLCTVFGSDGKKEMKK